MATTQRTDIITVADLELMPDDGNRYEVIDGELYVTHAPNLRHQFALDEIVATFRAWRAAGSERGVPVSGAGLVFSFDTGVIPDFAWVSSERAPSIVIDPTTGKSGGRFYQSPDLLVEIVSPGTDSARRDRETKLALYSRRGAREYWIVDYERRTVEVYRRTPAAALVLAATLTDDDTLTSPLLPEFSLPVARVFSLPPELAALLSDT
ncbi:MAG: Uma2 family endonuclease [Chloroflexi bacterium]|nr:Uma2 family endonuclease [Chloroflexota bacterium]